LTPQKWRFLIRIQVEQPSVIQIRTPAPLCGWVKVFLRDGRISFPRHQLRTIVVSESPVLNTITAFALWRIEKIWFVWTQMQASSPVQAKKDNGCKTKQPSSEGTMKPD
jgi:hypothetical protein